MKRFYFIAVFVFAFFMVSDTIYGQQHLTFKGIAIDGTIGNFTKTMLTKGFTVNTKSTLDLPRVKKFNGDFMGKKSEVWVLYSDTKLVWKVMVFQQYYSWSSLRSAYTDAVELYTKKYGAPADDFRFFTTPYEEGDGFELQAIRMDKCHYASFWELPEGMICVKIYSIGDKYYIVLGYEDKINFEIKDKKDEAKALSDI